MNFSDAAKADFESIEDRVKKAEEDAINWFHEQRVAQHNEAVGAIKDNSDNQPKTVSSVDELPVYNPDAVVAPAPSTPVQTPTSGVPDNVGHGAVTVVDPPKDETSTDVEHPVDQGEAITPEGPEIEVEATPGTQPVVVEQHETQTV